VVGRIGTLVFLTAGLGWSQLVELYRFDDKLKGAVVSAPQASQAAALAAPMAWKSFDEETPWEPVRGRMGIRNKELIVVGQGSSPVIQAPKDLSIDWSRYESIRMRMMAEGGTEAKIRIGDYELKQKLAPAREYQVYEFEVNLNAATYGRPLAIMPTDSVNQLVSISSIELIPRRLKFTEAAGRQNVGKQEEYRNTLHAAAPSSIAYDITVPASGRLTFGLGIVDKPVTFRVTAGGQSLFSKTMANPDVWEDSEVDLSSYAGRKMRLVFQTESATRGTVGLWANPLMTTAAAKRRPNVLIYMVDTLRASHTGVHGYSRATTPFLNKLAAEGVVFEDCHAQATWTKPSVASMMTSLYSFTHGINMDTDTIPKGATTLAEQMRAGGYVTASAIANPFAGRVTGLERGFDYLMEYPVIQRHRTDAADRGTDSAALNRVMMPWLERHRNEPFLLYVHSTDPHAPYRPPAEFEKKYANPLETPGFNRDYGAMRDMRAYGGGAVVGRAELAAKGLNPDQWIKRAIDRYDGEVEHNDRNFEALVAKLRELRILDDTLIVFVSDHGEEFFDHGWTGHGHSLYEELTHTVWVMWNKKMLPAPRRVKEPVQLIDLMPTLLEITGVRGQGIMQGVSVVPLTKGAALTRKQPVMSSRFRYANVKAVGFVPENQTGTFARIDSQWRLISRDDPKKSSLPAVELYDRRADPSEAKNLVAQRPEVVKKQLGEIQQWIEAQKQIRQHLGNAGQTTMDPQTLERLKSLGYIGK
jgi:choline-sulfatase